MNAAHTTDHGFLAAMALLAAVLPLLSFLAAFFTKKNTAIALVSIFLSFLVSAWLFGYLWNENEISYQLHWFSIAGTDFSAGIMLNNLTVLMLLLVSGIALLVHLYSVEYMHAEPYLHRYWAYLGLFCFAMLGLVMAGNLLLIYMFWELVGFSSYLLIGFWYTRDAAAQAAKKAFIMNRIGDAGFLAGMLILYSQFRTLDVAALFGDGGLLGTSTIRNGMWMSESGQLPSAWFTVAGIAFFLGAMAKSAQFPLHTWLADAMEGPTSVSSLIHAATMVAAGVFLLARIHPVFNDTSLLIITVTGAFTACMAATIALAQYDIKRILAFSTISQLGFMMVAMGTGATGEGMFHLATHAFFKCLLFLAAGAIIHQLHRSKVTHQTDFDHQDIRNMGGLREQMPLTFYTMLIAALAIAGIPFTSGYLSKDAILIKTFEWASFNGGMHQAIPYLLLISTWLTTFYIARLLFVVFFGKPFSARPAIGDAAVADASWKMNLPLIILACCCLFPLFSANPFLFEQAWLLKGFATTDSLQRINAYHTIIPLAVNLVSLLLIYLAYTRYATGALYQSRPVNGFTRFLQRQWYTNEVYSAVFVKPLMGLSRLVYITDRTVIDGMVNAVAKIGVVISTCAAWTDRTLVDGLVNGAGILAKGIGNFARSFQTGRVQTYLLTLLVAILSFFILTYFL